MLEAFHCAAYSQILRRYWKVAFEDIPMRGLMINSILATDMGLHFNYMKELGNLQSKVYHNNGTDGWSPQVLDDYRILTCALLVKCADISNVVSALPRSIADVRNLFYTRHVLSKSPFNGPTSCSLSLLIKV